MSSNSRVQFYTSSFAVPCVGRHDTDGNWVTYEDIVQQYAPLPEVDQVKSKDDGGRPSTLGFNGVTTIEKRTRYAASKIGELMSTVMEVSASNLKLSSTAAPSANVKLGGVMIWEVGQDCRLVPTIHADGSSHVRTCPGNGDDASLLVAITKARETMGRKLATFRRGDKAQSDDSSATKTEL